ncbi:MAG: cytochrome P450 [Myxococcota bacterium]
MATAIGIDVEPLREIELDMSLDLDPDFDIFEAYEVASGNRGPQVDPYPEFHRRREEQPVYRVPEDEAGLYLPRTGDREGYIVYRYQDVSKVAQDSDTFCSAHHAEAIGLFFGHSILEMVGEEHALHRRLIQHAFKRRDLAHWKEALIPQAVNESLDSFASRGHANLTSELTLLYPVRVIEGMMGLPKEHLEWFHRRAIEEIGIQHDTERALKAADLLRNYFEQVIEIRRKHPGKGDLITLLVEAEVNGKRLRNDEIIPFLMLLSPAGAETTYRATGTLLYALLANPEQFEAVKRDRSLIAKAIEESLRWDPPLTGLTRRTTREVEFQGVRIPEGSNITGCLASANRDPEAFKPADTVDDFDLFRPRTPNLTFAGGAHVCLGQLLARAEMEIALNLVIDRLPDLRFDPEQRDETFMTGEMWRSPNKLPVLWNPA